MSQPWLVALAFCTGFIQLVLTSYQIRQLALGACLARIFVVACILSTFWLLSVHMVMAGYWASGGFVLGAGLGTVVAMKLKVRV